MKKPRTPQQQAREAAARCKQKEKMLIVAAELFREKGFDRATLDDIAARFGVAKPRFYRHFKNKEKIFECCIDRALHQWAAAIKEIEASSPQHGKAMIGSIVEKYADVAFGDFGMCWRFNDLGYLDAEQHDNFLDEKTKLDVSFKSLITRAVPEKFWSHTDPEFLWLVISSLIHGVTQLNRPRPEKQQALSKAIVVVLAGLNIEV